MLILIIGSPQEQLKKKDKKQENPQVIAELMEILFSSEIMRDMILHMRMLSFEAKKGVAEVFKVLIMHDLRRDKEL